MLEAQKVVCRAPCACHPMGSKGEISDRSLRILTASLKSFISGSSTGISAMFFRTTRLLEVVLTGFPSVFVWQEFKEDAAKGNAERPTVDQPIFFRKSLLWEGLVFMIIGLKKADGDVPSALVLLLFYEL